MKIKGEYVLREIAGEHILVPVGSSALEINGLITLDEVGVFIWERLEKSENVEEIVQDILNTYDVEESVARKDLEEFLYELTTAGIVE